MPGKLQVTEIASIPALLQQQAAEQYTRPAIEAIDSPPLSYSRLWQHIQDVQVFLQSRGLTRRDRVMIVMPNGPQMATLFLGVSSGMVAAPMNPTFALPEYDYFLTRLGAKAVIIQHGLETAARDVAQAHSIPIIDLYPSDEAAGLFTLHSNLQSSSDVDMTYSEPDDVALIMFTSGTTSQPKAVPLTHDNLMASAGNVINVLGLRSTDRSLNVVPLFHIHGLMAPLLGSLRASGQIICTPGYDASQFLTWLADLKPTWYTAAPTIHQSVLSYAVRHDHQPIKHSLRFIRSSAASLAPEVLRQLERIFNVPVIETYGMTESAAQITSNPMPPAVRKPGSVGLPHGTEIAIMDDAGSLLPQGATGEIVFKGRGRTPGYENNPDANAKAFINGWFRTGDQGYIDSEGYLFITGRIKEIINRGGEKISPREVDEVLLTHPDIVQAVAFAMPHETLGEEVAAAVILREGAALDAQQVREYVAERLASYKVPQTVVFVNEIPKGPTGKLQRIGLAQQLGLVPTEPAPQPASQPFAAPRTPLETTIAKIWKEILKHDQISVYDRFYDVGGHSLLALQIVSRLREELDMDITIRDFLDMPTIADMAVLITARQIADADLARLLDELEN